jgi:predicted membrane protein
VLLVCLLSYLHFSKGIIKLINKTHKFTIMETNESYRDERRQARDARRELRHEHHHLTNNRAIIGVILVMVGLFLVLRNTGFFPDFIDHVIFSWPMLLVAIGLVMTLGASEKTSGVIVMAVGGFFLIPMIFRETFHAYNMFWPSIFIIIGVIFIFTKRGSWNKANMNSKGIIGDDFIDYVNVFSGGERQIVSENFRGGRISAVFGGMELDLTKAKLAPGRNDLEIACVFGGATLIVPDDWNISIEVTPVLGGFSDSRKLTPGRMVDPTKQLVIKGAVVFGGGEIKSY